MSAFCWSLLTPLQGRRRNVDVARTSQTLVLQPFKMPLHRGILACSHAAFPSTFGLAVFLLLDKCQWQSSIQPRVGRLFHSKWKLTVKIRPRTWDCSSFRGRETSMKKCFTSSFLIPCQWLGYVVTKTAVRHLSVCISNKNVLEHWASPCLLRDWTLLTHASSCVQLWFRYRHSSSSKIGFYFITSLRSQTVHQKPQVLSSSSIAGRLWTRFFLILLAA